MPPVKEIRESKNLTTSKGHYVVYKAWVSGRESNDIQSVYLKEAKLSIVNGAPQIDGFSPLIEQKATEKLIEVMVMSMDNDSTDLVNRVSDLPVDEYDEVVSALKSVTETKKK